MKKIISLIYHDVYDKRTAESGFQNQEALVYKINAIDFENQVKKISSFKEKYDIRFTFDDGGSSFYVLIAPILEKYNFKGYYFISSDFINKKGFLTENQLRKLSESGHFIGSHSSSHPRDMTKLSCERQFEEWDKSKNTLEKIIGKEIVMASIPNGQFNKKVLEIMIKVGIREVYTSIPRTGFTSFNLNEDLALLSYGRFPVRNDQGTNRVISIMSSRKNRILMYLRWMVLQILLFLFKERYYDIRSFFLKKNNTN